MVGNEVVGDGCKQEEGIEQLVGGFFVQLGILQEGLLQLKHELHDFFLESDCIPGLRSVNAWKKAAIKRQVRSNTKSVQGTYGVKVSV